MTPALADRVADRLSRALVRCYPRRWRQRYATELLDVLDQHRAGPRTVLSLAGGALSTHLDPNYRMQVHLIPRPSRDTKLFIATLAAFVVAVPALWVLSKIPNAIRESRWEPSRDDSVGAIAFSSDQRILLSATGGPPWSATSTLWDLADQARPRRLSEFEGGSPATISPDGATVATNASLNADGRATVALWNATSPTHPTRLTVLPLGLPGALWGDAFSPDGRILAAASTSGLALWNVTDPARPRLLARLAAPIPQDNPAPVPSGIGQGDLVFSPDGRTLAGVSGADQITLWNVAHPDRATPIATLTAQGDSFTALAFSPHGNLLAGITYHGSVLVFRLTGPAGPAGPALPVRVALHPGLLATAKFPGGGPEATSSGDCDGNAAYAAAFTTDGSALTVVIARPDACLNTTARDTVFTWHVDDSGALGRLTTIYRDVNDAQPTLAPGARTVADGSITGADVHLWTLP